MFKRFNIGIDVDGVLCNFLKGARETWKPLLGGRPDDSLTQTGWDFDGLGISKEEKTLLWKTIDATPDWWRALEVLPETDFLPVLTMEHRCIFITNRKDGEGDPIEVQTQKWLIQNFNIENPVVIISDKKGPIADGLKLDFFIDDRPKNVEEVVLSAPACETYLYHTTYNLDCQVGRMYGFDMFAKYVLRKGVENGE